MAEKVAAAAKAATSGVVTRATSKFNKGKDNNEPLKKVYSREDLGDMRRSELRELAKKLGVAQSGSDADLVDRLAAKYEEAAAAAEAAETAAGSMIGAPEMPIDKWFYFGFTNFPEGTQ